MDVLYEYRLSGRRPVIWLCGLVCGFFVALLFKYGAALVVWLRSGRTVRVNHLDIPPMSALRRTLETKAIPVIQT